MPAILRPRYDQATVFIVPMTSQYRSKRKDTITTNLLYDIGICLFYINYHAREKESMTFHVIILGPDLNAYTSENILTLENCDENR